MQPARNSGQIMGPGVDEIFATKEEFLSALPKHQASSALDELFKDADEDRDGAISQSELETGLRKHLSESGLRSSGSDECDQRIAILDHGVAPGWLVSGKPRPPG